MWRSVVDLFWDTQPLLLALLGPVLVPLAPVLAIWTAYVPLTDEEVRERMRRGIHQNGGAA
jgi:heme/copper-type cytochrome/quinol oxidase subunit 1